MKRPRISGVLAACAAAVALAGLIGAASPAAADDRGGSSSQHSTHGSALNHTQLIRFRLAGTGKERIHPDAFDYANASHGAGPLLLFLPATGSVPAHYQYFLRAAAAQGYHVLGLDYWNTGRSVIRTCGTNADCFTQIQRNRLDGSHPGRFSAVNTQNSIVGRLRSALSYLGEHQPHAGWGDYANAHGICWNRIVVAGHSQGGGESAYIAHRYRVQGALMFSSPVDTDNGVAASWMHESGATPASQMYGFDNRHDMYFDKILGSWNTLGLGRYGAPVQSSLPTGSHELISTGDIGTPVQAHSRSVSDSMPGDHGSPVFLKTWTWMLGQVKGQNAGA